MSDLLKQLEEAKVLRKTKHPVDLIEVFEGSEGSEEVLDEATLGKLTKLKGFPDKDNREMVLRAKVGHAGIVNRNNRMYPVKLMEREVASLQEKILERSAFANDQHPRRRVNDKGVVEMIDQPTFGSTTFIPFILEMNKEGEVFSTGVVPKTDAGRNFAAVVRAGGRPGFSTRGGGSVATKKVKINETEEREVNVVQEDFKLKTFDTVIDQSVADATIQALAEATEEVPQTPVEETAPTETLPQKQESPIRMKLSEWLKKYGEAGTTLIESVKDGSISLVDLTKDAPELAEALRKEAADNIQEEVQSKLFEKYGEYLESIKGELTQEQLEEAAAEGIAEFLEHAGIDAEMAQTLIENEDAAEVFRTVLQEMAGEGGKEGEGEGNGSSVTEESLSEAIAENPTFKSMQEQLRKAQIGTAIAEARASFPYGDKVFEKMKGLLEACESPEEVKDIMESQMDLLRAAGSKEVPKGASRFLATDSKESETARETTPTAPKSMDEELLEDAANALQSAPVING